jgi:hypothetical protein
VQLRDEPAALNLGWIALGVMVLSSSTYNAFAKVLTGVLSPITLVFMSEMLTGFFVLLSFGTVPAQSTIVCESIRRGWDETVLIWLRVCRARDR